MSTDYDASHLEDEAVEYAERGRQKVAKVMHASWSTYDSASVLKGIDGRRPIEVEERSIVSGQTKALLERLESLSSHVEEMGIDRTLQVVGIFGIYSFSRFNKGELSAQLARWEEGER